MDRFACRSTALAVKTICNLSKANIVLSGEHHIPADGGNIFVINHFTRIETFLMPYIINKLTNMPVWSLADYSLFKGAFGNYLERVGAVSTKNPDRDRLIVKTLLTGEGEWIIFPEGRMVKNQKLVEKGRYVISYAGGKRPPHSGAAALALRTEFYRRRMVNMARTDPNEMKRLLKLFEIDALEKIQDKKTYIVPINLTYYPLRARENILSKLASGLMENIPERVIEELMTEGSMLLSGVDIHVRFGSPISVNAHLAHRTIEKDISKRATFNFDDVIPSRKRMHREALKIMHSYMKAIYGMTTVNHDHLFASVLRAAPKNRMDDNYLKKRVFLLASQDLSREDIFMHPGLESDQVHLLTDDRFNKYRDFLSVATQTGVVEKTGGQMVRNASKFSSLLDFHRVRIDNPIAVMANAVEPMTHLQRRIRKLAWTPSFMIRRKIVKHILNRELHDFKEDYETHYLADESKDKEIGRPFLIKGKSRKKGVVLVHGYMAAPAEVKALAQYLGRRGMWVYVPRLRGHGTSPLDLAARKYTEWILSVERAYAVVGNICERVVMGGFSTGGGLALYLAAKLPTVSGVFAVSPPMRLQDFSARLVPAMNMWNHVMKKIQLNNITMEFVQNRPENPHINYFRNPVAGIRELERLMMSVSPLLPAIRVPALIAQAKDDPVVDPKGSKTVFDSLGSQDKSYVLFNFSRHGILLGEGAEKVHHTVADFVENL